MSPTSPFRYCLDTPAAKELPRTSRISGWYLPPLDHPTKLLVHLDGEPYVTLQFGTPRPDVAEVHPAFPAGPSSGFVGDLWVPDQVASRGTIEISIWDHGFPSPHLLAKRRMEIKNDSPNPWRERAFDLITLLRCPKCGAEIQSGGERWSCVGCQNAGATRGPAFFFLECDDLPYQEVTEKTQTHHYGEGALELLQRAGDGLVLDFGAGNSPDSALRPHTCYLDIKQYAHTDVISPGVKLPFRDNVFDGIVSQSVFEHIPDPFFSARELFRVLKPGGEIFVDTAFMQPFHAGPSHYFNMTRYGIRQVFEMFEEKEVGIAPYHLPSYGLMMQLDMVLPDMAEGNWKNHLQELRDHLGRDNLGLDRDLGPTGRERLAAGWYFEGRKPLDKRS